LEELRSSLKDIGSNLLVTKEKPEDFIPHLMHADRHNVVVFQQEICKEELDVEKAVVNALKTSKNSISVESVWGSTLHHIDDLSYDPHEYLPHIYGKFREKNAGVAVRKLVDTPKKGDMPYPSPAKDET
jgi:deoxyribodipyrimidine photo-lyase